MATPNYSSASSSTPLSNRPRLSTYRTSSDPVARSKILLLGMRRAGKTSIQQVLFKNLPPKETFYLETTMRIVKHRIDTIIPLELWDCPANTTVTSLGVPLAQFATIIFVIDIRDLYNQPISKLVDFVTASYAENPEISVEVFVHKAEKLQEDDKIENFRQIHERVTDRLSDLSPEYEQMHLDFHLTSVYEHSLHEAFSKVLHKLIDSLPYLEELLNVFCANSQSPKAFLFDIRSRLYIATDASPVDSATHNLCCDYLLMLNSFGPLYWSITASPERQRALTGVNGTPSILNNALSPLALTGTQPPVQSRLSEVGVANSHQNGFTSPTSSVFPTTPSTPRPSYANGNPSNARGSGPQTPTQQFITSQSSPSTPSSLPASGSGQRYSATFLPPTFSKDHKRQLFYPSASTTLSASMSVSSGGTTLTYHLITKNLALLALIPTAVFEERRGLVEYNVVFFREGVQEICDVEEEVRAAG